MSRPELWPEVRALFQAAVELPVEERLGFLAASAAAAEVRIEVERLLAAHAEAGDFLEAPARLGDEEGVAGDASGDSGDREAEAPPARVGPYRVLSELGRGGMGTVYLAARDDQDFHHEVAIKVIKRGMDSAEIVRRFHHERRILAGLEHPAIARLYDGGTTAEGLPYFVMERVEGEPIDEFCARHGLLVDERLRLFCAVCGAVQAAHQRLVVHRDLKPGNILVTAEGSPKLLDFGIAKLLEDGREGTEEWTKLTRLMTPEYASPEQVRGEPVTTASDVYALGVILYRLLTGRRPYSATRREELTREILDRQPRRPSSAVADPAGGAARAITRRLRGDLDNIVLKAVAKEPDRRYGTAAELAEDLRRHLDGLPVRARPGTAWYRTGRFLTRHRAGAGAAGVTLAALSAALVFGMMASGRLETPRQLRSRERAEALQLLKLGQERLHEVACGTDALLLLEQAIERDPSLVEAHGDLGWALYNQVTHCGKEGTYFERALAATRSARAVDPEYSDAWLLESAILVETGRAEQAFERIRDAARRQPRAPEVHFAVAYVATYSGYLELAAAELDRALALEPTYLARGGWSPNAYLYRGELAKFMRQLPAVDSPFFSFYRAWVYLLQDAPGEARAELETAFRMNPPDVFARLDRALLAVLSGDRLLGRDVVRELARQRRELGATDGELTLKQAQILALSGEPAEAAAQLRLAVEQGFFCPVCIESDPVLAGLAAEPEYLMALEAARLRHESFGRRFDLTSGPS